MEVDRDEELQALRNHTYIRRRELLQRDVTVRVSEERSVLD